MSADASVRTALDSAASTACDDALYPSPGVLGLSGGGDDAAVVGAVADVDAVISPLGRRGADQALRVSAVDTAPMKLAAIAACRQQTEAHDLYGSRFEGIFQRIYLNEACELDGGSGLIPPVVPAGIVAPIVYELQPGLQHKGDVRKYPPQLSMDPELAAYLGSSKPLFAPMSDRLNRGGQSRLQLNGYRCEWSFWYRFANAGADAELRFFGMRQDSIDPATNNVFVTMIEVRNSQHRDRLLRKSQLGQWEGVPGGAWWTRATDIPAIVRVDRFDANDKLSTGVELFHLHTGAFVSYANGKSPHIGDPAVADLTDALTTATRKNAANQERIIHRITLGSAISENVFNSLQNTLNQLQASQMLIPQHEGFPDPRPPLSGLVIFRY